MKKLMVALLSVGFIVSAAEIRPVAAWDFNKLEDGKTPPSAGKYTALVAGNKYVEPVPGKLGKAVRIQGKYKGSQAGAIFVKNFKFDFTKPFTVEVLVRFEGEIDRKQRREIFSISDTERGPGVRFSLYYNCLYLSTGDGKQTTSVKTDSAKVSISPDKWHLLTITGDGLRIVLYVDGVPAGESEMAILPARKVKMLSIGSYKNGLAYPLQGSLDDIRFYDVCKTPEQVSERYISIFGE